jgi:hypothetical protein
MKGADNPARSTRGIPSGSSRPEPLESAFGQLANVRQEQ